MEDAISIFSEKIKNIENSIENHTKDVEIVKKNPVSNDDFKIELNGKVFTDRKEAGDIIVKECQKMKTPLSIKNIGSFGGFKMELSLDTYVHSLTLKGNESYFLTLGSGGLGNIAKISNCHDKVADMLEDKKNELVTIQNRFESAKIDVLKEFTYEEEYLSKTSRLFELNIELSNSDENFEKTDGNEVDNGENADDLENEDIDNDVETDIEEIKIKRSENSER